jgi:CBS domain-containing protein
MAPTSTSPTPEPAATSSAPNTSAAIDLDRGPAPTNPVAPGPVPIDASHAPLVLMELIQRLKVRDVMSRNVITATRSDTVREVQQRMKEHRVGGLAVCEDGRLYGVISTENIIQALEWNHIEDPCDVHMTTRCIVLQDDMPLSFAIRYFDRYEFGRFPVLDSRQRLAGIITARDINRALLVELATELHRMEKGSSAGIKIDDGRFYLLRDYQVASLDFENAGKAANEIRKLLREHNVDPRRIRRVAVAAYELEINLVVHSNGGLLSFLITSDRAEVTACDNGPGIPDIEWALQEGNTTANEWIKSLGFGAGLGLVNVKRVADVFDIKSSVPKGTTVKAVIHFDRDSQS